MTEEKDYYQLELDDMVIALNNKDEQIEHLQEQLESAQDAIYEYIQLYGVERKCSKYLVKYAQRTK